jgi:hypothetical protein
VRLHRARLAEHDRIDRLEMARVWDQREVDVDAVEGAVGRRTEMIFDVARAADVLRIGRAAANSEKITRYGLPITLASTLRRPRWAMPSTISRTPNWPPYLMTLSSAGTIDSPPSRPKRLVPTYLRARNFSHSRFDHLGQDRELALGREADRRVLALHPFLRKRRSSRSLMCIYSRPILPQ